MNRSLGPLLAGLLVFLLSATNGVGPVHGANQRDRRG